MAFKSHISYVFCFSLQAVRIGFLLGGDYAQIPRYAKLTGCHCIQKLTSYQSMFNQKTSDINMCQTEGEISTSHFHYSQLRLIL